VIIIIVIRVMPKFHHAHIIMSLPSLSSGCVVGATRVLLADLSGVPDDFTAGVADRMHRAASGKRIRLHPGQIPHFP